MKSLMGINTPVAYKYCFLPLVWFQVNKLILDMNAVTSNMNSIYHTGQCRYIKKSSWKPHNDSREIKWNKKKNSPQDSLC